MCALLCCFSFFYPLRIPSFVLTQFDRFSGVPSPFFSFLLPFLNSPNDVLPWAPSVTEHLNNPPPRTYSQPHSCFGAFSLPSFALFFFRLSVLSWPFFLPSPLGFLLVFFLQLFFPFPPFYGFTFHLECPLTRCLLFAVPFLLLFHEGFPPCTIFSCLELSYPKDPLHLGPSPALLHF